MTRDGMPRAYLRVDPNVDQVYPELRNTFVGLLCSGHRQPERGRYRDRRLVEALHSRPFVARCYARGDLVDLTDGRVYIDGWDEWQEGDFTVAERMRRMRQRRRNKRNAVTPTPSPGRSGVTTDASTKGESGLYGVGVSPQTPTGGGRRANGTNPRAVAAELTRRAEEDERERKARRQQRYLAYSRGLLTEAQRDEMNDRDADLSEIPATRGAAYAGGAPTSAAGR